MLESDAGTIQFAVAAEGYMQKQMSVEVKPNEHTKAQMELRAKNKQTLVVVKKDRIRIKRQVHFKTNSDEIDASSFALLDEVADTLMSNPQILKVEIQGHTDDRGQKQHNIDLSQARAESVRNYLVSAGVSGDRLEAKGYGPTRPIAPNVIKTGRARNRRVEFHITESE
ncbi:MAG: OmpA family protein [Deltaproteobacteria bacterium]|nr:OmpA family protein [Deltaproteobacteria bacterium]MBN2672584.1 OmpA family protein [Deltaproteobacteria bacterium]